MIEKDYTTLILQGLKNADQIGGPFELANIFSKSLIINNGFNEDHLKSSYLFW